MKKVLWTLVVVVAVFVIALIGGSFYMLDYSLAPDPNRMDTDSCYQEQFEAYPESKAWVDSLRRMNALCDTFLTMPSGERHHAFYIDKGSKRTAIVIHGWRDCAIKFFWLARIYEQELGYNVVMPELHGCGESEGDAIQMGWKDRFDALHWLKAFQTDTMVVHGVSMGAATTMMLSAETMPEGIKDLRFVEDCGYTSVWDEFAGQLKEQFGLPTFPLMYTTSLLCKLRYGWTFSEASALEQVKRCSYPMLFIHGSSDTFVPTQMVYPLYEAKQGEKSLWIADGADHALSYREHKTEYIGIIKDFVTGTTSNSVIGVADTSDKHTEAYIRQRIDAIYSQVDQCHVDLDSAFCTQRYYSLLQRASQLSGKTGFVFLDYNHWIMGQDSSPDCSFTAKKIDINTDSTAVVEMDIRNFGQHNPVTLELRYERGDWYVDDFVSYDGTEQNKYSEIKVMENFIMEEQKIREKGMALTGYWGWVYNDGPELLLRLVMSEKELECTECTIYRLHSYLNVNVTYDGTELVLTDVSDHNDSSKGDIILKLKLDDIGDLTGECHVSHRYLKKPYEGTITLRKDFFFYRDMPKR